jgi:hypothetical protein
MQRQTTKAIRHRLVQGICYGGRQSMTEVKGVHMGVQGQETVKMRNYLQAISADALRVYPRKEMKVRQESVFLAYLPVVGDWLQWRVVELSPPLFGSLDE